MYSRLHRGSPGRSLQAPSRSQNQHYRFSVVNPCEPERNTVFIDSQTRRWHHVDIAFSKSELMRWKSLCSPASLPLTTDFFPSEELLKAYQEYTYSVSPNSDDTGNVPQDDEQDKVKNLLVRVF